MLLMYRYALLFHFGEDERDIWTLKPVIDAFDVYICFVVWPWWWLWKRCSKLIIDVSNLYISFISFVFLTMMKTVMKKILGKNFEIAFSPFYFFQKDCVCFATVSCVWFSIAWWDVVCILKVDFCMLMMYSYALLFHHSEDNYERDIQSRILMLLICIYICFCSMMKIVIKDIFCLEDSSKLIFFFFVIDVFPGMHLIHFLDDF